MLKLQCIEVVEFVEGCFLVFDIFFRELHNPVYIIAHCFESNQLNYVPKLN